MRVSCTTTRPTGSAYSYPYSPPEALVAIGRPAPPRQRPAPAAERLRKATSGLSGATERFYQIQAEHDAMMSTMDATPRPRISHLRGSRLAIAPPAPSVAKQHGEQTKQTLAIGSPLNTDAHFERLSARTAATVSVDGSPRSAYARSRSSLMGAWSPAVGPALSQKMRSDPLELLPSPHERSPSPPACCGGTSGRLQAESLIKLTSSASRRVICSWPTSCAGSGSWEPCSMKACDSGRRERTRSMALQGCRLIARTTRAACACPRRWRPPCSRGSHHGAI